MDLKILPEGLTVPTVSGVICQRQPIVSWSQPVNPKLTYHLAIEDASSNDVFSEEPSLGTTSMPDLVTGLQLPEKMSEKSIMAHTCVHRGALKIVPASLCRQIPNLDLPILELFVNALQSGPRYQAIR